MTTNFGSREYWRNECVARQGVHKDVVAVFTQHREEFPAEWHDFLDGLVKRAQSNIEVAEKAE